MQFPEWHDYCTVNIKARYQFNQVIRNWSKIGIFSINNILEEIKAQFKEVGETGLQTTMFTFIQNLNVLLFEGGSELSC